MNDLTAKEIKFSEVIKVGEIYKLENYIILRNTDKNAKYLFYVYSFPDIKFLYPFCPRRNGPDEYLLPTVIKNIPGDSLAFRDHATDIYSTFNITDSLAILEREERIPSVNKLFCWEINYIRNNEYLLKRTNSKKTIREFCNLKENHLLDSLPNTFNLSKEMGKNYYSEFDDCWLSASNNHFASAYFFIDRIEFGNISGDKLHSSGFVGMMEHPDFYLFNQSNNSGTYKYNVDNNIVYYESLYSTYRGVYGLYSGVPWGELEKKHSSTIEVYDWKGNPLELLKLNKSISSFVVDEKTKCIYGINPDGNEDEILSFSYENEIKF